MHITPQPPPNTAHDAHIPPHRSFLKRTGSPNIPIQAIGLSLYESLPTSTPITSSTAASATAAAASAAADPDIETPGTKVTRTQWLDLSSLEMANLIGKRVLIVDEVDDTRTTLEYAVRELAADVESARRAAHVDGETTFSVFVLHNKDKPKRGTLPQDLETGRYLAAETVGDVWICYPWEAT